MIKSKFITEKNYLHVEYLGSISSTEIFDSILNFSEDSGFPRNLKIFLDIRAAHFEQEVSNLEKAVSLLREKLDYFDFLYEAILVDKPIETAFSMIFQNLTRSLDGKYIVQVFNTQEAALKWLLQ